MTTLPPDTVPAPSDENTSPEASPAPLEEEVPSTSLREDLKTVLDNFSEEKLQPLMQQLNRNVADHGSLMLEVRKWAPLLTKLIDDNEASRLESKALVSRVVALETWREEQEKKRNAG